MDSPCGITIHRARREKRREISATKQKRRCSHHLKSRENMRRICLDPCSSNDRGTTERRSQPKKAWKTCSTSHASELDSRRYRLDSAVTEEAFDDEGGGYYYTPHGKKVLKKQTLPEYSPPVDKEYWNSGEEEMLRPVAYKVYNDSTPSPTHTRDEWETTYRHMIFKQHQSQLSAIHEELTTSNRLYETMCEHARRLLRKNDKCEVTIAELEEENQILKNTLSEYGLWN